VSESNIGTIVLVHGAFEHAGRYDWLANQWYKEGYNVLYDDLPGQGNSEGIKGHIDSFDEYIQAIEKWIKEAEKLYKPIFLLGHSMGGLAVIRYMEEKKPDVIKGVILSSPGLGISGGPPKWLMKITESIEKVFPKLQVRTRIRRCVSTRNKTLHNRHQDPLFLKKVSIRWYHEFERAIRKAFLKVHEYPSTPTLLMQAGKDFLINVKDVRRWYQQLKIPNKHYNEWDHLYHEIFNEPEREYVFQYAKRFVNNVVKQ